MGVTEDETQSDQMRVAQLPVVSDTSCIESQEKDFKKYITFTSFCAGWRNGGYNRDKNCVYKKIF